MVINRYRAGKWEVGINNMGIVTGDVLLVVGSLLYLQVSSHILVLRDVP